MSHSHRRQEQSLDTLESLFKEVRRDWPQTTGTRANPLDIALPLLDHSSIGLAHRRNEFIGLKERIEAALKSAVDEHFDNFNESIGSYRTIVKSVADSKMSIAKIQENVQAVANKNSSDAQQNAVITGLNENFKTYNEMIEILTVIERVKSVPLELDSAMSDKNYAKSQQLIQEVYASADTYRLWELPALANLKEYFQVQEEQLFEILVEEFHNIIYSKRQFTSYNTVNDLLKSSDNNSGDLTNIEKFLMNTIETDIAEAASVNQSNVDDFIKTLNKDAGDMDGNEETALNELSLLQESNPFVQLLNIMTIIYKLGKLTKCIDIIDQRFGLEITQMINRVAEDTKLRHPKLVKLLNSGDGSEESYTSIVVQDLFWNLFKKLLFFLQTIRVLTEIHQKLTGGVAIPSGHSKDSSDPYNGLILHRFWGILSKEVQSLIMTYIAGEESITNIGPKLTTTNSLKPNSHKPLFQFYQVEYDRYHTTQMKTVLQDLFPGFINTNDMLKIDSPYIEDSSFLKQSKIIPADIMNMRYILEPLLLFIQGSSSLLHEQVSSEPLTFFKEFMNAEFLPLLEDHVLSLYFEEVESVEPFMFWEPSSETLTRAGGKQIKMLEIFLQFKQFFDDVCFILNTSLQFRAEFMPVVFKLLEKFHDKIEGMYKELFSDLVSYLEPNKQLIQAFKNHQTVTLAMLGHRNKVEFKNSHIFSQLEALQNSLELLLKWMESLVKKVDLNKTDLNLSQIEKLRNNWFFFQIKSIGSSREEDPLDVKNTNKLILNDELSVKFSSVVGEYQGVKKNVDAVLAVYHQMLQCV